MQTVPQLFVGLMPAGRFRCYYCGGSCTDSHPSAEHVKKSFTSRDTIAGGDYVCDGCLACMSDDTTITLPDLVVRRSQRVRCYSWILTPHTRVAATKSHRGWLLDRCLTPPPPPFAIVLSDSGQKHLLYRGVICWSHEVVTLTLETERITYRPQELADRIALCKQVCTAIGKPGMASTPGASELMRVCEIAGESVAAEWEKVQGEPLSRLAVWLCPPKEECCNESSPAPAARRD